MQRLSPSFREKIWGSTRLEPWFLDADRKIGEVWFETGEVPLLIKFLFTTEKLSVQVHPGGITGKTEMWHILAAEPGAKIAAGFRETLTAAQMKEAALSGEIENLLQWFDARPGDTFFIPAGTVHAIGGGLALCEIQQRSDITYRLYDYGRGRELHLDEAMQVSHLGPHAPRVDFPVRCEYFITSRDRSGPGGFVIAIAGQGAIASQGTSNSQEFRAGDVFHLDSSFEISGDVETLTAL
jgi:mannose-6-phosphate isomerase